jgi:tetratricopeptide (TPR) repeat protein
MALSYMDLGRPEEATRLWEQAFTVDPGHVEAIYNHTLYSWRAGKIIDVEALKRMRTAQSGNACQYAQALLQLERGAGDEAIEALSGSSRDAEVTAVIEEARKVGQPDLLQTLTGSTLAPFKYDYPTDKGAYTVSFSDDGTYLNARDRAKTKKDRFTYHNGM